MRKLIITGMPRSGTSWLGQIINSSPKVMFRTEPLFAYRFKNIINQQSSCQEINNFFISLIDINDDFILQTENQEAGYYPKFKKTHPNILAFKTTRHFELIERYLECVSNLDVIAIIRHPCATINSWFNSYREFEKKGCLKEQDWRTGGCRKGVIGEYWGFNDWLESTKMFLAFSEKYSNFHLIRYSDLVRDTNPTVNNLFSRVGIDNSSQTENFLVHCHQRHDSNSYSVYKSKSVLDLWETELDRNISDKIIYYTNQSNLSFFLE